jgi:hypothetical protein
MARLVGVRAVPPTACNTRKTISQLASGATTQSADPTMNNA